MEMQKQCFGTEIHPSFEYTYNQLQLACIRAKDYEKAEDVLGALVNLRQVVFGDKHEGLL